MIDFWAMGHLPPPKVCVLRVPEGLSVLALALSVCCPWPGPLDKTDRHHPSVSNISELSPLYSLTLYWFYFLNFIFLPATLLLLCLTPFEGSSIHSFCSMVCFVVGWFVELLVIDLVAFLLRSCCYNGRVAAWGSRAKSARWKLTGT